MVSIGEVTILDFASGCEAEVNFYDLSFVTLWLQNRLRIDNFGQIRLAKVKAEA